MGIVSAAALCLLSQAMPGLEPGWDTGTITYYYESEYGGKPLYCGGTYSPETGPWLAVDVTLYTSRQVRCGDLYAIELADGSMQYARALDAFPPHPAVIADLPNYWRGNGRTQQGKILNLRAVAEWKGVR